MRSLIPGIFMLLTIILTSCTKEMGNPKIQMPTTPPDIDWYLTSADVQTSYGVWNNAYEPSDPLEIYSWQQNTMKGDSTKIQLRHFNEAGDLGTLTIQLVQPNYWKIIKRSGEFATFDAVGTYTYTYDIRRTIHLMGYQK